MRSTGPFSRRSALLATSATATLAMTALLAAPADAAVAGPAMSSATLADITADANWLRAGQLSDGAIAWYVDQQHISPYQANYAAIGLAEAARATGDASDATAAWHWLQWYAAHEDANGYVTDYDVANGVETSTGDEDSTDAYAGTYLLAVRAAYRATGDRRALRSVAAGVQGALRAIESTQDSDGLTRAKPTWHVKYLMDQAETYAGLRAAADLGLALGNYGLAWRAWSDASAMRSGIDSLWNASTGAYDWAKHDGGDTQPTDWTNLYSDAMQQAWEVAFAAGSGSHDASLLTTFDADHPTWDQPAATDVINGAPGTVGYWPVAGWAFLRAGQTDRAAAAAANIRAAATAAGNGWPFTTGVAGELIVLESGDLSLIG